MSNRSICTPNGIIQITPLKTDCPDTHTPPRYAGSLNIIGYGTCVNGLIQDPCAVAMKVKLYKWNNVTSTYEPYAGGSHTPFDIHAEACLYKSVDCGANFSLDLFIPCFMTNIGSGSFKIEVSLFSSGECDVGPFFASATATFSFP